MTRERKDYADGTANVTIPNPAPTPPPPAGPNKQPTYGPNGKFVVNKLGEFVRRGGPNDFAGGVSRVPGHLPAKGTTDVVAARLTPGEAVLNREAATKLGRHEISRLNRVGRDSR